MENVNIVLGTMTFGESVFHPDIRAFVDTFLDSGYEELDTAYVYNNGNCEKLLGEVLKDINKPYKIASKVNPRISGKLDGEAAYQQLSQSLERLGASYIDIFYLHFPDPMTPIESVLETCNTLWKKGKFRELGLSNFPAWMVADAWHKCDRRGWVKPTVYEGIYNPLTRKAETELKECLNNYGLRFYAYNPLAGGLLTGRYGKFEDAPLNGRFTNRPNYQGRYWKKSCFEAVEMIKEAAAHHGFTSVEATYRWLSHHSMLCGDRGDAIIMGASKLSHLEQNLKAIKNGRLPVDVLEAFDRAWNISKAESPEYFTLYKGNLTKGQEEKC